METTKKNKSIYHWVILVCCVLTLMFAYSTRFGLSQLFTTEIIKETGFATSAYFLCTTIASVICIFTGPVAGKLLRGNICALLSSSAVSGLWAFIPATDSAIHFGNSIW